MGIKQWLVVPALVFASGLAHADNPLDFLGGLFQGFGQPNARTNVMATYQLPESTQLYIRVNKGVRSRSNKEGQTLSLYVRSGKKLKLSEVWDVSTGRERWENPPDVKATDDNPNVNSDADRYFSHTPTGRFHPQWLDRYHKSTKWADADMPFAVFFDGGVAIHCTTENHYAALGTRDSGACVRLHCDNGQPLFEEVEDLIAEYGKKSVVIDVFDPEEEE